MRQVKPG